MARKSRDKEKITDPFERARLKKLRAAQRREERKARRAAAGNDDRPTTRQAAPDYAKPMVKDDYLWIRKGLATSYANRILNDNRQRPYWLSFRFGGTKEDGSLPVSHFYPCTMFRMNGRVYYGFLFREHRDMFFATIRRGRKELTCKVRSINPSIF